MNRSMQAGSPVHPVWSGRVFVILAVALLPAILACTERGASHGVAMERDSVRIHVPAGLPERVVAPAPALIEIVIALGTARRLVARTAFDEQPEISHLRSFGRTLRPSVEAVVGLEPGLVLLDEDTHGAGLSAQLAHAGIATYQAPLRTTRDIIDATAQIGRLLGAEQRAAELTHAFERSIDSLRATRPSTAPTVFYMLWHDPLQTIGSGTYIDEVIELAGARNVFGDLASDWPQVTVESLLVRDPDVLVVPTGEATIDVSWLRAQAGWRDMTAVRAGRVVHVDGDLFHRPGPRFIEAAVSLRAALERRVGAAR